MPERFTDKRLSCSRCSDSFLFSALEQEYYTGRGISHEPTICHCCYQSNRESTLLIELKTLTTQCTRCRAVCSVPYQPGGLGYVFCRLCRRQMGLKTIAVKKVTQSSQEVAKQDVASFRTETLVCEHCGNNFEFDQEEKRFFSELGFKNKPKRCVPCRGKERALRNGIESHKVLCFACGVVTYVPFQPTGRKPIYCTRCWPRKRKTVQEKQLQSIETRHHPRLKERI